MNKVRKQKNPRKRGKKKKRIVLGFHMLVFVLVLLSLVVNSQ